MMLEPTVWKKVQMTQISVRYAYFNGSRLVGRSGIMAPLRTNGSLPPLLALLIETSAIWLGMILIDHILLWKDRLVKALIL